MEHMRWAAGAPKQLALLFRAAIASQTKRSGLRRDLYRTQAAGSGPFTAAAHSLAGLRS